MLRLLHIYCMFRRLLSRWKQRHARPGRLPFQVDGSLSPIGIAQGVQHTLP